MAAKPVKSGQTHRRLLRSELMKMRDILINDCVECCPNAYVLSTAINELDAPGKKGPLSWQYNMVGLEFYIPKPRNAQPSGLPGNMLVTLDIAAKGVVDPEAHDPFTKLNIDIQVFGKNGGTLHHDAWHLDRHEEGKNLTKELHPLYHLQRGGDKMIPIGDDLGQTMILESPRIAHPPLDIILAIDYLLSHYAGKYWRDLQTNPEYQRLVREAQIRLWGGYAQTLAGYWDVPSTCNTAHALAISPSLL